MSSLGGSASSALLWDKAIGEEISFLSFLFCQPLEIVVKILNHLNPGSLKNLAFTCKPLFHVCLGAKGVNMVFVLKSVEAERNLEFGSKHPYRNRFKQYLEQLGNWPFSVTIDHLKLTWLRWDDTLRLKEYFKRNKVTKISCVEGVPNPMTVQEMGFLTEFLQVSRLRMEGIFTTTADGYFDSILSCNIPNLHLGVKVNLDGFQVLFDMWMVRTDITNWKIDFDPWINFLLFFDGWDIRDFDTRVPLDPTRRTVFLKMAHVDFAVNSYYLRRPDGKVLRIVVDGTYDETFFIEFSLCRRQEIPPALRGN